MIQSVTFTNIVSAKVETTVSVNPILEITHVVIHPKTQVRSKLPAIGSTEGTAAIMRLSMNQLFDFLSSQNLCDIVDNRINDIRKELEKFIPLLFTNA